MHEQGQPHTKFLEIRDSMTYIPVLAIETGGHDVDEVGKYHLWKTGYEPAGDTILVVRLTDARGAYDPYDWPSIVGGSRTMPQAHEYIQREWHALANGDVVDVQFILGETNSKKISQRLEP